MKKRKAIYLTELWKCLSKSADIEQERALLKQLFKSPLLKLINPAAMGKNLVLSNNNFCRLAKNSGKETCLKQLHKVLKKVRKSQQIEQFVCPANYFGLCLPLLRGDTLYGFMVLCHLNSQPLHPSKLLLQALNSAILEKIQKEMELSKLYRTIRPRAIALSTIHTIRRLLSSTLDLHELLPRIARLTLQVLRAKRCVITLADKKKRQISSRTIIDLTQNKPRVSAELKQIEKRLLVSGNILLKKAYIAVPLIDEDPIGLITVANKIGKKAFDNFDQEILVALSEQAVGAIKNAQLYKEQENMLLATVQSLASMLQVKSAYPYAHSKAFVDIVLGIAQKLHLREEQLQHLRFAAMLHDAGEISIPEKILKKPAHLTGKEFDIVKKHPRKSAKILTPLERLKPVINIILHHHEKFDGTGYPDNLRGEEIPLGSRIMAVADSFDAMTSGRPYREKTSIVEAIKELKRQAGTQFDPRVIQAFCQFTKDKTFKKLVRKPYFV